MLRLVALRVPPTTVDNDSTKFLQHSFVVSCLLHAPVGLFVSAIAPSGLSLSYLFDESSQSTIGSFLFWCFFCCCVPDVRLGLSMETLLDPGRRFVQESLCGRVGLHQR